MGEAEDELVRAGSIGEEYAYIDALRCDNCGGEYRTIAQALMLPPGKGPVDHIELECTGCGQTRTVSFDISEFYGK
jgi:hypothetical protein